MLKGLMNERRNLLKVMRLRENIKKTVLYLELIETVLDSPNSRLVDFSGFSLSPSEYHLHLHARPFLLNLDQRKCLPRTHHGKRICQRHPLLYAARTCRHTHTHTQSWKPLPNLGSQQFSPVFSSRSFRFCI